MALKDSVVKKQVEILLRKEIHSIDTEVFRMDEGKKIEKRPYMIRWFLESFEPKTDGSYVIKIHIRKMFSYSDGIKFEINPGIAMVIRMKKMVRDHLTERLGSRNYDIVFTYTFHLHPFG